MSECLICGAEISISRRGMCNKHYRRWLRHGDPRKSLIREHGQGTPHIDGYWAFEIDGRSVLRHILVAERALGKRLPKGAVVHHVDGDRRNDSNDNLVICPSAAYHQLIHVRTRALEACGHADWLHCFQCGKYSPPSELRTYEPSGNRWHPQCAPRRKHAIPA